MRVSPSGSSPVRIPPPPMPRKKRPPIGTIVFVLIVVVAGYWLWHSGTAHKLSRVLKPKPTPARQHTPAPGSPVLASPLAPAAWTPVPPAPAVPPAQPPQPALDPNSTYVWAGVDQPTIYHRDKACPHLKGTALDITLAQARKQGMQPCPDCHPPR